MRGGAAGSFAIFRRVFFDFISASICRAVFRWALVRGFRDLDLLVQSRMNRIRLFRLFRLFHLKRGATRFVIVSSPYPLGARPLPVTSRSSRTFSQNLRQVIWAGALLLPINFCAASIIFLSFSAFLASLLLGGWSMTLGLAFMVFAETSSFQIPSTLWRCKSELVLGNRTGC